MAKTLSPELKAVFRPRIRHVHLPDLPPHYAPRSLPGKLRDFLHSQILGQRYIAEASAGTESNEPLATGDLVADMRTWLRQASPPPTVLSFTRRPTYVLPKHYMEGREAWEVEYMTASLKSQQDVVFPQPPKWSSLPFRQFWEAEIDEKDTRHNPLAHKWQPGVMVLPCAEPMYFGPGQLSIWPVMDLLDNLQRGKSIRTKHEYERILEDTTIQVLKREYGLDAFSIPGKPGVWVESLTPPAELSDVDSLGPKSLVQTSPRKYQNTRRIATVHADFVDNITRHGVSIHVGQPAPDTDIFGDARINPWAAIRQDSTTTSIVSELALKGFVPHRGDSEQQEIEHRSDKKSSYLQTAFDENSPFITNPLRAMPYSLVALQPGLRQPAPMGLDNRDLSTAWTHEFARQLGLLGGVVDHLSNVDFPAEASSVPTRSRGIGFMARPVMGEDQLLEPYEQVEVPIIQLTVGGPVTKDILRNTQRIELTDDRVHLYAPAETWAISWPLYYHNVTDVLAKSVRGLPRDTRLTQLLRNQTVEASIDRRWQAIKEAEVLKDAWRAYQKPRGYEKPSSLPGAIVADITKTTQDMQAILNNLKAGRLNIPRKKLLAKTEHLQKLLQQNLHTANGSGSSALADDPEASVTANGLKHPVASSPEKTDTSLLMPISDAAIRVAGRTLDQAQVWASNSEPEFRAQIVRQNPQSSKDSSKERPAAGMSETAQNLKQQLGNERLPLSPVRLGKAPLHLTPTRAERRARKAARADYLMQHVKAAKLGPPTPKPIHQPLPTRRELLKRSRPQPRDTEVETDELAWLMPSTQRVAARKVSKK